MSFPSSGSFEIRFARRFAEEFFCLGPEVLAGISGLASAAGGASSLLPVLLSAGTSLVGGQIQANAQRQQQEQQLNQDLAGQSAKNQVLQQFLSQQRDYQAQNQKQINTAVGDVSQPNLAAQRQQDIGNRVQDADSAVAGIIKPNIAPPSATGSQLTQNDLNARVQAGQGRAQAQTSADATKDSYGDVNAYLKNSYLDAARNVATTNNFASGDAALLGPEQSLADFQARVQNRPDPVSTFGSGIQGLGNVFAALAGSRRNATSNLFG